MKSQPEVSGDERLICYTSIDERHQFKVSCKQIVAGETMGAMAGLMICFHERKQAFYLFGCDADWQVVTDTWHQTLEDAQHQAEFEYDGVSETWIFAEPGAAPNGGPAAQVGNSKDTDRPPSVS